MSITSNHPNLIEAYVVAGIKLIIPQKIISKVLMKTVSMDVQVGGISFQLSDDGDPTRKRSQASSRK